MLIPGSNIENYAGLLENSANPELVSAMEELAQKYEGLKKEFKYYQWVTDEDGNVEYGEWIEDNKVASASLQLLSLLAEQELYSTEDTEETYRRVKNTYRSELNNWSRSLTWWSRKGEQVPSPSSAALEMIYLVEGDRSEEATQLFNKFYSRNIRMGIWMDSHSQGSPFSQVAYATFLTAINRTDEALSFLDECKQHEGMYDYDTGMWKGYFSIIGSNIKVGENIFINPEESLMEVVLLLKSEKPEDARRHYEKIKKSFYMHDMWYTLTDRFDELIPTDLTTASELMDIYVQAKLLKHELGARRSSGQFSIPARLNF